MAGRDLAAVDARRAELGVDAITVQVDATDEAQVADAALNCDLVLNLAGLDHATPISGARGALAAGCQYVDIGASATAVLTLLGWTDEFEAAGLACLPSIGLVPGAMNLLACQAAAQLDRCDSVSVNCCRTGGRSLSRRALARLHRPPVRRQRFHGRQGTSASGRADSPKTRLGERLSGN